MTANDPKRTLAMRLLFAIAFLLSPALQAHAADIDAYVEMAKSGNVEAMYQVFLEVAKKGSNDRPLTEGESDLARYWLLKAGENNNWRAAKVLELCYEKGCWGLPIDAERSRYYRGVVERFGPREPQ